MNKHNILFFLIAISLLLTTLSYATTDGQIPEPARPMPYTDFLSLNSTAQMTITTAQQIATGGYIIINNESGGDLRVGTDSAVLANGFLVPATAVIAFRLWRNQPLYIGCSTTCDISYIKGN